MAIEVSIIVPCRNEVSAIATTLESIRSQDPIDGDFEVIVADGMSDDGSREILNQLIEANSLKQKDLIDVFGTLSIVSEVLSEERGLTIE